MSDPIRDANLKAMNLVFATDAVYFAMLGAAKPRLAIEQWAKLARLLHPNTEKHYTEKHSLYPEISSIESTFMTARGNTPFRWSDQEFTSAHCAAEELASDIGHAVNTSIKSGPGLIIVIVDWPLGSSDPAEWKARSIQYAHEFGLLDSHGEPTDAWPAFQQRYLRAVAGANWTAGSRSRLQTALRLEANAAHGNAGDGAGTGGQTHGEDDDASGKGMSVDEANENAMKRVKEFGEAFFSMSQNKQAELIGCHARTWKKTPLYQEALKQGKITTPKPKAAKAFSLTSEREAVTGEGNRDEILSQLIADQETDKEPSPLESDPPNHPRKIHSRKRL